MSEHMRRLHINTDGEVKNKNDETVSMEEVFKNLYKKYGVIGSILRGCRSRDDLTQAQLAKLLGIPVKHVSEMEYSKRTIDKKMAQKLAKIFRTTYRLFIKK